VERLNVLAGEHGFKPYYVLVAPQSSYLDEATQREPANESFLRTYERVYDVLRSQPGFIDARFYQADGATPLSTIFVGGDRDPLPIGGRHFNEQGYRLLAEMVLARLLADGVGD
jgi:hypothetical protein